MKKCLLFGLAVLLVCMSFAGALNSASYQIFEKRALVELNFEEANNLQLEIPYDALAVELNTDNYEINDFGNHKIISVGSARNLAVKYITESLVEKSKERYFLIIKNKFPDKMNIQVYLPEGAILSADEKKLIVPNPDELSTDGRRIILKWNNFDKEEVVVAYEFIKQPNFIYWIVVIVLIAGFAVLYFLRIKKIKKRLLIFQEKIKNKRKRKPSEKKEGLTRNLFGEEKQIVEYLLEKKKHECWTKEIVKDLNISKVRASRRLRDLEKKGLVERVSYGNENRIRLISKLKNN